MGFSSKTSLKFLVGDYPLGKRFPNFVAQQNLEKTAKLPGIKLRLDSRRLALTTEDMGSSSVAVLN